MLSGVVGRKARALPPAAPQGPAQGSRQTSALRASLQVVFVCVSGGEACTFTLSGLISKEGQRPVQLAHVDSSVCTENPSSIFLKCDRRQESSPEEEQRRGAVCQEPGHTASWWEGSPRVSGGGTGFTA